MRNDDGNSESANRRRPKAEVGGVLTDRGGAMTDKGGSTRPGYSFEKSMPGRSRDDLKKGYEPMGKITGDTKSDKGFA